MYFRQCSGVLASDFLWGGCIRYHHRNVPSFLPRSRCVGRRRCVVFCAAIVLAGVAEAQTVPTAPVNYRQQLRTELDSLLRTSIQRPYGTAFTQTPEPGTKSPVVTFEATGTPAAGLICELAGTLLAEPRYHEAAVQVSKAVAFAVDNTGRVPATAQFMPTNIAQREAYGAVPRRGPTTASLAFLLILDRDMSDPTAVTPRTPEPRVASTAVRNANWLLNKAQYASGVFPAPLEVPGERNPRKIVRLDTAENRDSILSLLLILTTSEGRDTTLPVARTKVAAERALAALLRARFTEAAKPSRHLWPPATELDGGALGNAPTLPPAGSFPATNYAIQTLLTYHLLGGNDNAFDIAKLAGEAVEARKTSEGLWPQYDDPNNRFPPPPPPPGVSAPLDSTPAWPRGEWGLPATLRTLADMRVLGRDTFNKLTGKTLPNEVFLAALIAGLTDQLPSADLPLSASQIQPYIDAHPEVQVLLRGPEPVDLTQRTQRLWTLYLLATLETRFEKQGGKR